MTLIRQRAAESSLDCGPRPLYRRATVPSALMELERDRVAGTAPQRDPTPAALPATLPVVPAHLAALPPAQRAQALAGLQRGEGNAAVARAVAPHAVAREGQRCACGGTIGADGQCDRCRALREAGVEPEGASGASGADAELARMLADAAGARSEAPLLARQTEDGAGEADAEACTSRCGGISSACPPPFCCPYPLGTATIIREQLRTPFLLAIASQVTPSVVPVWLMWFTGGSGMQNFTGRFGLDFSVDPTTAAVAGLLAADVQASLDPTQLGTLAAGATPGAPVSLQAALPGGYTAAKTASMELDGDPLLMDFNTIGTAPGNLAGGVGKTQTTCAVGATPGAVDDARILTDVQGTLIRNPDGSITVTPTLHFRVIDTVDLCPGNCGSGLGMINEQLATYPMSRLEASGVCGDVPFTVDFTAAQPSFVVPAPAPPVPQHVVVSATTLFEYGSAELAPGAEEAIATELGDRPINADLTQAFTVEGHTDGKGSEESNQRLSERRAATVIAMLERRYPNLAGHLTPQGFGETRPLEPNEIGGVDNPAGRARNRRVELHFAAPPAP